MPHLLVGLEELSLAKQSAFNIIGLKRVRLGVEAYGLHHTLPGGKTLLVLAFWRAQSYDLIGGSLEVQELSGRSQVRLIIRVLGRGCRSCLSGHDRTHLVAVVVSCVDHFLSFLWFLFFFKVLLRHRFLWF